MRAATWLVLSLLACVACSDDASGTGAGGEGGAGAGPGATTTAQTSATSSTTTSATTASSTTTTTDTSSSTGGGGTGGAGGGEPIDGYGAISGTCGEVDLADILDDLPQYLDNGLDFTSRLPFDDDYLSPGGMEIVADGNLGGSSLYSEVFAYEVLYRCEGAALLKTEGEIIYQSAMGKKTDILLEIDGERVGVSVVRAMSYPEGAPYPVSQAFDVLEGKLADILLSSANVDPQDGWPKQILAVIAQTPDHADAIEQAWAMVDEATKADTIVYVTVTEGEDDFIYYE
jgi:hypothetical protein